MSSRLWRWRWCVIEAAILLFVAQVLIRSVRFSLWRELLGQIDANEDQPVTVLMDMAVVDRVARTVRRAARQRSYRCLPQAMATQWMLARRGVSSRLMFGVATPTGADPDRALHAWVQVGAHTVIGGETARSYLPALALARVVADR